MSGTQIILPTTFTGAGSAGLPFIIHGLPGPAPAHRYVPYAAPTSLGANIGSLPDQSGGLPLTQSTEIQRPSLEASASGQPYLLFDIAPGKESLQAAKTAPAAISIAVVFEFTSNPFTQYIARYGGKNVAINGTGNVLVADSLSSTTPPVGTSRKVVIARFSATDTKVWVNGTPTTGAGASTSSDAAVFWGLANNTKAFRGYELAFWDQPLTDAQAIALNATLMSTWGIL